MSTAFVHREGAQNVEKNTHQAGGDPAQHQAVHDAYGPAALAEAQKVRDIVRNSNSPETGYAEAAAFLNKHSNNATLTNDIMHDLKKADGKLLPDLSVVYEKHQLSGQHDGLSQLNAQWDKAMAAGVEQADLRGHARYDAWNGSPPIPSRDITMDDVNAKLADMHHDGQFTAMHSTENVTVAHTKRALNQTLDANHVKFEGLSKMIAARNPGDPGQAAADMLADDGTGTLRSSNGNVIHLTALQRNALENVKTDYEVRAGLYPDLYSQATREHTNLPWWRPLDKVIPDTIVIPRNPVLFIKGLWDGFVND